MKTASKIGLTLVLTLVVTMFISSAGLSHEMNEKEYNAYLIKALKDDNIGIRTSAVQLLGERKVKEAVKPLVKMLNIEKNYAARIIVALALHQIGDEKVLLILKEQLKKDRNRTVKHVLAGIIENLETTQYANANR